MEQEGAQIEVNDLKKYHKNPRLISEKQKALLQEKLIKLGDLSGIVHDLNSGEIISGNQRTDVFSSDESKITIEETFDPPTRTGTIATGYITYQGERFSYRQVRWTPEQCEEANIVANKVGGEWDFDILLNQFNVDGLLGNGFERFELGLDTAAPEPEVDVDDIDERLGTYLNNTIKQIVLYYPNQEYDSMVQRLGIVIGATGVADNSEAVVKLLEFYEQNSGK